MEVRNLHSFWKKKADGISSKKHPTTPNFSSPNLKPLNRNANNSNNKETMDAPVHGSQQTEQSDDPNSTEEFGEIHPQITPEGYGLRTPYGTHFNLDFLNYCQNIAENQSPQQGSPRERRSSLSSQKSGLDTPENRSLNSGSEETTSPNARAQVDGNLWETRRRLDAFRSYRRKTPTSIDKPRYLGNISRLSPKGPISGPQKDQAFEADGNSTPTLTKLLNVPFQQQNLQVVREQMAAALARLKFLENEVKQIQVLQVQISVLQQEKQKLNTELKVFKESSHAKDKENFAPNGGIPSSTNSQPLGTSRKSLPPPPPQRKYISVAVGSDDSLDTSHLYGNREDDCQKRKSQLARGLSQSTVQTNAYDPSVDTNKKDACVGIHTESTTKHTSTDRTELRDICTSSFDLVNTMSRSCGNHVGMHHVESQFSGPQKRDIATDVFRGDFSTDVGSQVTPILCDKAVVTHDDVIIKHRGDYRDASVGDGLVVEVVPLKCDIFTTMPHLEVRNQAENTEKVPLCEKSCSCTPETAEFQCFVDIRPELISNFTETEVITKVDSATLTDTFVSELKNRCVNTDTILKLEKASHICAEVSDFSCNVTIHNGVDASTSTDPVRVKENRCVNTDNVPKLEKASLIRPEVSEFSCNVTIHNGAHASTSTEPVEVKADRCVNTDTVLKLEKSSLICPEVSNFSCNVTIHNGADVSTSTELVKVKESVTNTDIVVCSDSTVQVKPAMSDAGVAAVIFPPQKDVAVLTDLVFENIQPSKGEISIQTDGDMMEIWYKSIVRQRSHRDAVTDTDELEQPYAGINMQSEIGAYVGQVESLLEEQQSLLADEYKDLGGVLDGTIESRGVYRQMNEKQNKREPKLIEELSNFSHDRYTLPAKLLSACQIVVQHHKNQNAVDPLTLNNSVEMLKEEWFLIAASHGSRPDHIKDFVSELRMMSVYVLTKITNSLDETGNSALHYAVSKENFALICTLIDIPELDVDQYNNAGYTASMLAAITRIETEFELQAIASLLQKADVSLHAKQAGQTALMLAVSHGCSPSSKLLLKAGADINAQDEDGSTALMCATEHGHIDLVKLLLAHPDCDPTITDNDGSAAINIAMDGGQRDIGVLLYVHLKLDKTQGY